VNELAQIVAGWPFAVSLAATVAVQGLRHGRRRTALNEALHEVRRPLQVAALEGGTEIAARRGDGPLDLAAAALQRLDREINGGSYMPLPAATVDARALAQTAVGRWRGRARLADGSLELRWNAGPAVVGGDRLALAQAIDNLIVNAIEHGGPNVVVSACRREGRLRIAVVDSGSAARPPARRGSPAEVLARLSGRKRRGHGLAVVRRVVAAHEGRFVFERSPRGSTAAIELPLADAGDGVA
jgi:signal transduction histidine kinase